MQTVDDSELAICDWRNDDGGETCPRERSRNALDVPTPPSRDRPMVSRINDKVSDRDPP
jgi:hypothetical protein